MMTDLYQLICSHYSDHLQRCCLYPGCIGESVLCNMIYGILLFLDNYYVILLSLISLVFSLYACRKSIYQKSKVQVDIKFYFELFLKYIEVPSKSSLLFWISLHWSVLSIFSCILSGVEVGVFNSPQVQQNLQLIVTSTGIIFPLLILIIDTKNSNEKGLFSNSEVLLRHAYAYPISLSLVLFLISTIIGIPTMLLVALSLASLSLTAFILFRVLEVFFKPEIWKKSEQQLVKHKVYSSIFEIINSRVNYNESYKRLDSFSPIFQTIFYGEKANQVNVTTKKEGIIESINWSKIKTIYNDLNIPKTKQNDNNEVSPSQISSHGEHDVIIRIASLPGGELDGMNNTLATIYFEKDISDDKIKRISKVIRSSYCISSNTESKEATDQITAFLEMSMFTGRHALDAKNTYLIKSLTSIYYHIAQYTIQSFKFFDVQYNTDNVKNEYYSIFSRQRGWESLEGLVENIKDLISYTFASNSQDDYRLVESINSLPYRLVLLSYLERDFLLFTKSISLLQHQKVHQATHGSARILSAFDSLLKFHIMPDLENNYSSDELLVLKQYFNHVLCCLAAIGAHSLENDNSELLSSFIKVLRKIKVFEHKYVREEIETQKIMIRNQGDDSKLKEELKSLQSKVSLVDYIDNCKHEICVSLLAYTVLLKDGMGRVEFSGDVNEGLLNYSKILFNYLSFSLVDVLDFAVSCNKQDVSSKWGLGFLEKAPEGRVYTSVFPSILNRIIGAIIIDRWIRDEMPENIDDVEYNKNDVVILSKDVGFRKDLESCSLLLTYIGRKGLTEETTQEFNSFLDNIIRSADLRASLKLCETDLSEDLISRDLTQFESILNENYRVRKMLLPHIILPKKTGMGEQWGINTNISRESYVEGERHPGASDIFASDMANSDDEFIYKLLYGKSKLLEGFVDIDSTIREAIRLGNKLDDLLIITSKDLYARNILSKTEKFKFKFQESDVDDEFEYADGFVECDEVKIPVYQIFLRSEKAKHSLLIVNRRKIQLKFEPNPYDLSVEIGNTGMYVEIVDPKKDEGLANNILNQKPEWLFEYPDQYRSKLTAKILWFRAFQKGFIEAAKNSILSIPIVGDDDDDE